MSSSLGLAAAEGGARLALARHPAFRATLFVAASFALAMALFWQPLAALLTRFEFALAGLLPEARIAGTAWFALPALGLAGGLLASVSPCVLPLLPLNVALIGAAEASGRRAVALSAGFVLGAAAALAAFGLVADLAGVLLVEQRGPVLIGVGTLLVLLGLLALEVLPLPFAGRAPGAGRRLGPLAAGAAFALVTTPCASPIVAALLAAAGAQGVPGLAAVTMAAFAVGYTALVFAGGVFGGNLLHRLRSRSFEAPRAAAAALLLVAGAGFAAAGVAWL